ncbi:MAG: acetate kinase [Chamaesiphon sp.]
MKILVLNAGSSSQKSCLYELGDTAKEEAKTPLWEAKVDWSRHQGVAELKVKTSQGKVLEAELSTNSRPEAIAHMLNTLCQGKTQVLEQLSQIAVVGHRVVHGGRDYREPTLITPEVKEAISRLSALAPAHNPANLEGIEAIESHLPTVPQVAVFDTAFHSQMPLPAAVYPGPYEWYEQGIRRYGFHGISHQYCAERAAQILGKELTALRLIICHLGNGCSLAAIRNGMSVDTTMGFTPLEGLMMGTRSGSVDPGILIYLLREYGYNADKLDEILNRNSGLKGISGLSGDMRDIQKPREAGDFRAQLAFDMYVHVLCRQCGGMLATLGGLDALVFTAGVGENSAAIREAACKQFGFLGLKLDFEKNDRSLPDCDIAAVDSSVRVLIVHTEEDWAIAQECRNLLINDT